ncbi:MULTISPECIES: GNAT family N-acetyltransferase [Thermomonospora]|uniref:GCN5-related N-acetyltransferase n=1 Tax=Thermomonospora curvata (strain ATCC 19995 / DSM 43183 / JCM 3096 / KCTC 9072 / NBRC 15933 / NCIMB 10081 / Henssen B9) TaxID=471852 RepID=D1A411_THECD|nr:MULTISPECIES: GNAT family N-acetyltransferase [Thermomonospora]ACY98064.1 GCN5-related N-acetyltransferase [Thermomonospora curvata DSM 43183]PKK14337.1 MAG: GNAT family N-acetyltransferase [Thermomonospora sp. CIF 1]
MDVIALGDPTDAQIEQWQAVVAAVWAHDRPGEPAPDLEQTRSRLLEPPTTSRNLMWAALDEGRMCAVACLRLPHDPDRSGEIDIQVLPGYRRRGIGTRLLATAADGLRAAGCKSVIVQAVAGTPAVPFLEARGFRCVLSLRAMLLRMDDIDPDRLAALVAAGPSGYRLTRWTGAVSDELAMELAMAKRAMADLSLAGPGGGSFRWDAVRVREMAEAVAARGDLLYTVAALYGPTSAPRIAGFTEVVVPSAAPERALQYDTAVVPEHRGRRLGIWLKAAMLQWLRTERPEVREIETDNADDNSHMLAVNEELGFRHQRDYLDYQADTADLPALPR